MSDHHRRNRQNRTPMKNQNYRSAVPFITRTISNNR